MEPLRTRTSKNRSISVSNDADEDGNLFPNSGKPGSSNACIQSISSDAEAVEMKNRNKKSPVETREANNRRRGGQMTCDSFKFDGIQM